MCYSKSTRLVPLMLPTSQCFVSLSLFLALYFAFTMRFWFLLRIMGRKEFCQKEFPSVGLDKRKKNGWDWSECRCLECKKEISIKEKEEQEADISTIYYVFYKYMYVLTASRWLFFQITLHNSEKIM